MTVQAPLLVPRLFHSEVANALLNKARKGEIAQQLDYPVNACIYLAAADALDEQLVTADERFLRKVRNTEFADLVHSLGQATGLEIPE